MDLKKMKNIISLGAGIQSTALVIMSVKGIIESDYAIFADTGAEKLETYQYLSSVLLPYTQANNYKIVILGYDSEYNTKKLPLDDWYRKKERIPYRINRSCTDNWKKQPIRRYLKKYEPEGANIIIGFSYDEIHRMRDSDKEKYPNLYPLIDMKITRSGLEKYFEEWNLPTPVKSGCYMCPFNKKTDWIQLRQNYPNLMRKAIDMENIAEIKRNEEGKQFYTLANFDVRLRDFNKRKTKNLIDITDDIFCGSSCMT